ncbi:MAG: BatA domain-containing protein [Verrucomicrobiota bacterium]
MTFLNLGLLFGVTAIAVPIIIHLLNRRRFQRVVWAAMRFLKTSVEQNQKRMRIEDLILLILRCVLVALIALALARPALRSSATNFLGGKVTGVLILDNSYSMSQTDGVLSRFEKGKQAGEQAISTMPAGSSVSVLLGSDVANAVIAEPTMDMNLVRKVVRDARLSDRGTDLLPSLKRAVDTLRKARGLRKEIYLVTDTQAVGWKHLADIQKLLETAKKDQIQTRIVFVGDREERNLGVSGMRLASGLSPVNFPVRLEVRVSNYGREEVTGIKVSLSVDGDAPQDETFVDVLPGGASKSVSVFARFRSEGYHWVTARIPEDRVPADDVRTMAIRAIREVRVLLVDGDPGREPRESQTFFLRHAFQPVPPAEANQYFIKTTVMNLLELNNARFDDYDAVVLANVSELPLTTLPVLEQYLRRGGGLMIFPGANLLVNFYNDQLLKKYQFLPAAYGQVRGQVDKEDQFFTLQEKDYAHPLVELWNEPANGTLASAHFYRAFELLPAAWSADDNRNLEAARQTSLPMAGEPRVVLRFGDGQPALMERSWGLGRVIQFCSTANTAWNDLAVRPSFVPLLHRALGAIVQRQDEGLNLRVGDQFIHRLLNEQIGRDVVVIPPGDPQNPQRDLRRVELLHGLPTLTYDGTDYSGVYEASLSGDTAKVIRFAAQPDAAESSLEEIPAGQLKDLENLAQVIRWKPGVPLRDIVTQERVGMELWLPLLLAALILAMVETFLAQHFSRTK